MFNPIKDGHIINLNSHDDNGYVYKCWVPPLGYGVNAVTGKLEQTDIIKRSSIPKEQYWERTPLPSWWDERRADEEARQALDQDYVDEKCETFRAQEWKRRLCGVWFWNYNPNTKKSEPIYLTGLHYFYINWWKIDIGYPNFRIVDRDSFYILQYCIDDPDCLGLVEVTRRKNGKTFRAGCFIYEYISRTHNTHGGIQSKNDDDAKEMYIKAVMEPWTELPDFFRPIYNDIKGDRPENGLYFKMPSQRGVKARKARQQIRGRKALNSFIDFKNAKDKAYDGPRLQRYVSDESGKLEERFDIEERQRVVRFTTDINFRFYGKHLYTTTVEDMESSGSKFEKLWKNSNPGKRDGNNKTKTGLYRYFIPGYRTGEVDQYGYADEAQNRIMQENLLKAFENDPISYASHVRKNPMTIRHAFWRSGEQCMYNAAKLNIRNEQLSQMENYRTRGNFEWEGGIRDSRVVWMPCSNGRWEICWIFPTRDQSNAVIKRGKAFIPANDKKFVAGLDPYQQDTTQNDGRRSKAAAYVLKRHDPFDDSPYNNAFICRYNFRAPTAAMMHEDMIKMCFYFGCPLLFETNKAGSLENTFKNRGYSAFLIQLPAYKSPGIPSTPENKQIMSELIETYIEENIDKVFFPELIDSWLQFDIKKTEVHDDTMGSGWTLVANMRKVVNPNSGKIKEISDYFTMYKAKTG